MRALAFLVLALLSPPGFADDYLQLYRSGGWPEQREHFHAALAAAQQRYRANLPPAIYQALVDNSNQRFATQAMDRRALAALRTRLAQPGPALAFFESPLGRKIVAAELAATRSEQLARNAKGLPRMQAEATRRLLIRHLAQAIPAGEAGAELSLALAGVAADSLSQMVPGFGLFGGGDQTLGMLDNQRQRIRAEIERDLDNTLMYVYRELSDPELEEFAGFAQSPAGQAYYQAALAALRAALAVGQQ
ncbi:DUF2059 domain-containing protein [Azotobacter beijerinckii]|uniref:DUF2059 domain-containing protein n=1 Tax=Azotobacter beijerinckii TaxID=170623 RepID=UPI002953C800|nr:DUF2059 domain-containing protein [Azotobacter beijerinckii]MDV7212742.1 DUF2059 domain-containing protein [Azotobacter beijerinckii]